MRSDNQELRGEVSMLKQKWDEMMEKMTAFTIPAGASPVASTSTDEWALDSSSGASRKSARGLAKPNMHKDVAPASKRTGTGSWTTSGMGTGYMPVHTTCVSSLSHAQLLTDEMYSLAASSPNSTSTPSRLPSPRSTSIPPSTTSPPPSSPVSPP